MTKQFSKRSFNTPPYKRPSANHLIEVGSTVPVDMMTGRMDYGPDQMTPGTESLDLKRAAAGLALLAVAACFQGGPGVVAPRISESPAVIQAPDFMPRPKR